MDEEESKKVRTKMLAQAEEMQMQQDQRDDIINERCLFLDSPSCEPKRVSFEDSTLISEQTGTIDDFNYVPIAETKTNKSMVSKTKSKLRKLLGIPKTVQSKSSNDTENSSMTSGGSKRSQPYVSQPIV